MKPRLESKQNQCYNSPVQNLELGTFAEPVATGASPTIQAKQKIGQPNDPLEQEADRIADQVITVGKASFNQASPLPFELNRNNLYKHLDLDIKEKMQRQPLDKDADQEEEDEEPLQGKQHTPNGSIFPTSTKGIVDDIDGCGQPLPESDRAFFEPRFGYDFSKVRIHTNEKAAEAAIAVNAKAFTFGHNIVFRAGEYVPTTATGQRLLAHELVHVLQQQSYGPTGPPVVRRSPASTAPDTDTAAKLQQLRRAADLLEISLESAKSMRDEQEKINKEQWAVSWTSEVIGSVAGTFKGKGLQALNIPDKSIWYASERLLKEVRAQIAAGDIIRAAHALQNLADEFTKANTVLKGYLEGVMGGAEVATTGLKAAAAAGAVAATIATGGIASGAAVPMLGIGASAGMGLLGTSTAIGVGAGAYGLTQETATQSGEMIAGTRKAWEFDYKAIAMRGGKDAIMGFVGAFAGGALSRYAVGYFGRVVMSRVKPEEVAMIAERLGVKAVDLTPQVFLSKGQQFIIDFFAGVATTPLTSAIEITLNRLGGQSPPSPEEFVKMVIDNAIQGGLIQLFIGAFTHHYTKLVEGKSGAGGQKTTTTTAKAPEPPVEPTLEPAKQPRQRARTPEKRIELTAEETERRSPKMITQEESPKPAGEQQLKATGAEDVVPALEAVETKIPAGTEPQNIVSEPVAAAGPTQKGDVQVSSTPPLKSGTTESAGTPVPPSGAAASDQYSTLTIRQLRKLVVTDAEAAEALRLRYREMTDRQLADLARRGDAMAESVRSQRIPPNTELQKILGSDYRPPHEATAVARDAEGNIQWSQKLSSGNMTPAEEALGYPRSALATHTEARAVTQAPLVKGGTLSITGQYDPCSSCQRAMAAAATKSGATIIYWWPGGRTVFRP